MRKIEHQRRDRHVTICNRLQIRALGRRMFDTMKAEPIIGVAARIAPFDHGGAGIIMETLPDHADALDLCRGDRGEVHIDQRARRHGHVDR